MTLAAWLSKKPANGDGEIVEVNGSSPSPPVFLQSFADSC